MINKPKYILVHCTDISQKIFNQFNSVNNYHRDERGFPKSSLGLYVGYHVLITGGKAYKCKEDWDEGAHCNQSQGGTSMNFQSLGICMGFDGDIEMPELYMIPLLKKQIKEWQEKYDIPNEDVKFHRDYAISKTCPGSLITRKWLDDLLKGVPVDPTIPNTVKDPEQQDKRDLVQQKINIIQKLIDAIRRILWEQYGVRGRDY